MDKKHISDFYLSLTFFLTMSKNQMMTIGIKYGLTGAQTHTLFLIDPDNPQPMGNLSNMLSCDASNVTGIIDGLEQKGLISRQEKTGDRRVKIICLEPSGSAIREQILDELATACQQHILSVFDEQETADFVRLVTKATQPCLDNDSSKRQAHAS